MNAKVAGIRLPVVEGTFAFPRPTESIPEDAIDASRWIGVVLPSVDKPNRRWRVAPDETTGRYQLFAAPVGDAIEVVDEYFLRTGPRGGKRPYGRHQYFVVREATPQTVLLDQYDDPMTAFMHTERARRYRAGLGDTFENYEEKRTRLQAVIDGTMRELWDVEAWLYLGRLRDAG